MISSKGLEQLGFQKSDFEIRNDSDGNGNYISKWNSASLQPTESEIETAHAEWKVVYDSQEYARKREPEYPPLNDLIVALWEGVVEERMASIMELEAQRQAVKAKHPKP